MPQQIHSASSGGAAQDGQNSGAPSLYEIVAVTKIPVEPCKALKSPFLVKRQPFRRPDPVKMERLYQSIMRSTTSSDGHAEWVSIAEPYPTSLTLQQIKNSVKDGGLMDTACLNLAVRRMGIEDAHNFRNTKCLGWRHYVDSEWGLESLRTSSDPSELKRKFYRGSIMDNASQSHVVFIPILQVEHWALYAFNMCDQKLSILDSLQDATEGGDDPAERHQKTRCIVCDALTITMNFAIDFRSWEYQFPKVPRQQDRCDSGIFVFNFMHLWDGHRLVRWFLLEPREMRNNFLAYILSHNCKDITLCAPDQVLRCINDLPGNVEMNLELQMIARKCGTLSTKNQVERGSVGSSNNASSDGHTTISIDELGASAERSNATLSAPDPRYYRFTSDGDGLFHIAASFGNVNPAHDIRRDETLTAALLKAVNNRGETPLHCAAAQGSEAMVNLFVDNMMGGNIAKFLRAKSLSGETCLHKAVRHGHTGVVKILISRDIILVQTGDNDGISNNTLVQIVDNEGISPLYLAATLRGVDNVKAITSPNKEGNPNSGIDNVKAITTPNEEGHHNSKRGRYPPAAYAGPAGKTALHAAVVLLHNELVRILLDWNTDLAWQGDESGSTPLHFLASLCLERWSWTIRGILACDFREARGSGITRLILEKDPLSALRADSTGSLPIHVAAAHGRLDVIKRLIKACPYCVSSRNAFGQTFLHVAVEKEKLEIVEHVCKGKKLARILNLEDQDGNTALHLAVTKVSEKIFCALMRNSHVCLRFANKEGRTPLDLAFLNLHPKMIRLEGPGEWIFFDLLHGGGDFGVCGWGHLAGNIMEPDWEKESERVGKSASVLAVCAVLILNASLLAPFSLLSYLGRKEYNVPVFQAFMIANSIAFVSSAAATFYCTRAGFAMADGKMRLKYLFIGTFSLATAAMALVSMVSLALFLVLPSGPINRLPAFVGVAGVVLKLFSLVASKIRSTFTHLGAIRARIGFLPLAFLLFQRRAVDPMWVIPSISSLFVRNVVLSFVLVLGYILLTGLAYAKL